MVAKFFANVDFRNGDCDVEIEFNVADSKITLISIAAETDPPDYEVNAAVFEFLFRNYGRILAAAKDVNYVTRFQFI